MDDDESQSLGVQHDKIGRLFLAAKTRMGHGRIYPPIEFYNEAGQLVLAYKVYRCWVSEYTALPDLDANSSAGAIESIKLETEGWERDTTVVEPPEPVTGE